jgi:hypothetical protein
MEIIRVYSRLFAVVENGKCPDQREWTPMDTNGHECEVLIRVYSRLFVVVRVHSRSASSDQCATTGGSGARGTTKAMVADAD